MRVRAGQAVWGLIIAGAVATFGIVGWQWLKQNTATILPMTPRRALGAAVVNGAVYAVGGWNGAATQLKLVERLDPATGVWTIAPPLQVARSQHAVIAAEDHLWVVGGWSAEDGLVTAVERFSPAQGTWEIVTHLPTPRREPGVSLWQRQLVVAGGFNGSSDADLDGYSDRVEAYDLDSGTWQQLADLGTPRRGLALVSVEDRLFAIGGYTAEDGFTNVVEEYDSIGKRWLIHPWSLTPRTWTATTVIDGSILIAGGFNEAGFLGLVEQVDPETGKVCQPQPLSTSRSWFALVPTAQGILALGGETAQGFTGSMERIETTCLP